MFLALERVREMSMEQLQMMWHHVILNTFNFLWFKPL